MTSTKIVIVSIVAVAALAAVVVVQQQTIKALRQENEALKQQVAQIAPLQEQLAQASQSAANSGGDAAARDAQLRDLVRLRGEVSLLRTKTNELAKARQEIQALNERVASESEARKSAVAETEQRKAATAMASLAETQKTQRANACINNLRIIDSAKQQWALEFKKQATDTPTMDDLRPYIGRGPNGEVPACPDGGAYTIGAVGEKPACSSAGHVLP